MKKMNQNIVAITKQRMLKRGICPDRDRQKASRVLRILYTVSAAVSFFMTATYLLGTYFYYNEAAESAQLLSQFAKTALLLTGALVFLIGAVVFLYKKKNCLAFVCTVLSQVTALVRFFLLMKGADFSRGVQRNFYWRHLPWAVICLVISGILFAWQAKDRKAVRCAYEKTVRELYKSHPGAKDFSDDEWNDFLNSYGKDGNF